MVNPSSIHPVHECGGGFGVFRNDGVGMARAVGVNVGDCAFQIIHHLNGQDQVTVLGSPIFFIGGGDARQNGLGFGVSLELDLGLSEGCGQFWAIPAQPCPGGLAGFRWRYRRKDSPLLHPQRWWLLCPDRRLDQHRDGRCRRRVPKLGMRVLSCTKRTKALEPRGMIRST